MSFDLVFRNARLRTHSELVDIAIRNGRIECVEAGIETDGQTEDIAGRLVLPGFIETHIHLDKSCLLGRCQCKEGTLAEAVGLVAEAKRGFTEDDVYQRAEKTLLKAIVQGTTRMRTHIEVDPRVGLTSLKALSSLRRDYAWAMDMQFCIFPQEGLLDDPGCEDVMIAALESGGDVVGGAPYMDKDSHGQIRRIFELAKRYDIDIDFHLDFSLDTDHLDVIEVCRLTDQYGWHGRVAVGHETKLSSLPPQRFAEISELLAKSGVAVTVLPSTDLFLTGRETDYAVPRGVTRAHKLLKSGVTCSISTNNVLNPFTPYGDCSLVRMANLYANVAQVAAPEDMESCLDMVTDKSAELMNLKDYGVAAGMKADIVVMASTSAAQVISELSQPLSGYKAGKKTFTRPEASVHRP